MVWIQVIDSSAENAFPRSPRSIIDEKRATLQNLQMTSVQPLIQRTISTTSIRGLLEPGTSAWSPYPKPLASTRPARSGLEL